MRGSFGAAMLVAMAALALTVGTAVAAPGGATGEASQNGYVNRVAPADSQVTPDLLASKAASFGRDSAGAAKAELGYPPAARALARREALANRTGKSPRTIARTQQGMPNVQHARLLVIPVEFNPNANDDFSGFERYDANSDSGCATEPAGTIFNGPTHNQIPDPAKTGHDNNTLWLPDFSPDYYKKLIFSEQGITQKVRKDLNGGVSLKGLTVHNYYEEISKGRYDLEGGVTNWIRVPHSEAW